MVVVVKGMRIESARAFLWLCSALGLVVSCGLTVTGTDAADAGVDAPTGETSTTPSTVTEDGSYEDGDVTPLDGDSDATTDAGVTTDADSSVDADADAGCVPTVIDDALSTIDLERWITTANGPGYPQVEPSPPGVAKAMISLIPPMTASKRGAIWLKTPVPTRAFDVKLEYFVNCPYNAVCADGFGVAWLDTPDAADLPIANGGGALGIPDKKGGAVTVTLLKNMTINYTLNPVTLAVRTITDAAPGISDAASIDDGLVKQLRGMTIRLRKGVATVTVGGTTTTTGNTDSDFVGYVGIAAATGSSVDAVYVSSFHGEFYDCDPP